MSKISRLEYENARLNDEVLAERVKMAETRVECEEKLATLHSQLNTMHKELRTTRQQLDLSQKHIKQLKLSKATNSVSKSEFIEVEQRLAAKDKEFQRMAQQLKQRVDTTGTTSLLEHKIGQLNEELQKIKDDNTRLRSNTTASQQILILEKQCKDHFRNKAKAEEALREKSYRHSVEVEKLNKTIQQFEEIIKHNEATFQAKIKEVTDESTVIQNRLEQQLHQMQKDMNDGELSVQSCKDENQQLVSRHDELVSEIDRTKNDIGNYAKNDQTETILDIEKEKTDATNRNHSLMLQIEDLTGKLAQQDYHSGTIRDLTKTIGELKQHNSELETDLTKNKESADRIEQEKEGFITRDVQVKGLTTEIEAMHQENTDMRRQLESTQNENHQLHVSIDKIKKDLDLSQSNSQKDIDESSIQLIAQVDSLETARKALELDNVELHKKLDAVKSAKQIIHARKKELEVSIDNETQLKEEALMQMSILHSEMAKLQQHCVVLEEREKEAKLNSVIKIDNRDADDVAYMRASIAANEVQINQIFDNMQVIEKAACEMQIVVDLLNIDTEYEILRDHIESVKTTCLRLMAALDTLDVF